LGELGGTVTSGGYNVVDVPFGTAATQSGWTAAATDRTFTSLGITGEPFNAITFEPVTLLRNFIPFSALQNFPTHDFNGQLRTWPGAPGAVR